MNSAKLEEGFVKGSIVFKITRGEDNKPVGMVITNEDYEKKLFSHQYQPILFSVCLQLRLAYLYGCMNLNYRQSREKTYTFQWREIGTNEWTVWFQVNPYLDTVYGEPSEMIV